MKYYVRTNGQTARREFIEALENKGYHAEEPREDILESRFPISVDVESKRIGVLHNTTCAAAAVSAGRVMEVETFYGAFGFMDRAK